MINNVNKIPPYIKAHKHLIRRYSKDAALIISEFAFKQQSLMKYGKILTGGYFFMEQKQIEHETGVTKHLQKKAFKLLVEGGLLDISSEKKGTPPKTLYKVNLAELNKQLLQFDDKKTKGKRIGIEFKCKYTDRIKS